MVAVVDGGGGRLPQRGCVRQPRVAVWPLPWGAIMRVINPNGVASGEESHYAAIAIIRSYSFGVFNERPGSISAERGNPKRNARLFGRSLEEIGLFSGHRRRHRRFMCISYVDWPEPFHRLIG